MGSIRSSLFSGPRIGYYGEFGGAFYPEVLHSALRELSATFDELKSDTMFWHELRAELATYSSRPTPLTKLRNLGTEVGATVYLKREDLNHTGAHKINNVIGQGMVAKRMAKSRVIAETGAGEHGVATATMAARLGLECTIYMGARDVDRQRPNVFWMQRLGAKVVPVQAGNGTLKDAINECFRDWSASMESTYYVLGTACGPHPYPEMVARFQSVIGDEARSQILATEGRLPTRIYACAGGGSNALGVFQAFLDDTGVSLVAVEAGGEGLHTGRHASRIATESRRIGIAQGYKTFFFQDEEGQMRPTHSIAAGLDYIGVSPILAYLYSIARVRFTVATDAQVIEAFNRLALAEGIIPALESSHAVAAMQADSAGFARDEIILVSLSGRGDKDIFSVAEAINDSEWRAFVRGRYNS